MHHAEERTTRCEVAFDRLFHGHLPKQIQTIIAYGSAIFDQCLKITAIFVSWGT